MIAIAPGDDAWGFIVSVYHYQAGREQEHGGAADPCPSSFLEMFCHDPKADPCPPVFRKNPGDPYPQEEDSTPIHFRKSRFRKSGWLRAYIRARVRIRIHDIYVYRRKLLIYSNIRAFVISSHLVKNY